MHIWEVHIYLHNHFVEKPIMHMGKLEIKQITPKEHALDVVHTDKNSSCSLVVKEFEQTSTYTKVSTL